MVAKSEYMNTPTTIELDTLNGWITWCANYIPIKLFKEKIIQMLAFDAFSPVHHNHRCGPSPAMQVAPVPVSFKIMVNNPW